MLFHNLLPLHLIVFFPNSELIVGMNRPLFLACLVLYSRMLLVFVNNFIKRCGICQFS